MFEIDYNKRSVKSHINGLYNELIYNGYKFNISKRKLVTGLEGVINQNLKKKT